MTASARALGSRATFAMAWETTYGTPPDGSNFFRFPLSSEGLGETQDQLDDDSIGTGREQADAILDAATNTGDVNVPVDDTFFGHHLKGMMGSPTSVGTVAATGGVTFAAQPTATKTVIINGITWTFVTGSPSGNQVQLGVDLAATMTALAVALNASSNAAITPATYTATSGGITIAFDALGGAGNLFTLATGTSNAVVSGPTLTGGLTKHTFNSGSYDQQSASIEIGSPELPNYDMNFGMLWSVMKIGMSRKGLLTAAISFRGQGTTPSEDAVEDDLPDPFYTRFTNPSGFVNIDDDQLGNCNANSFSLDNSLTDVEVIRPDSRIAGSDPGKMMASCDLTTYFDSMDLANRATNRTPTKVGFGWTIPGTGKSLTFILPRTLLAKPKRSHSNGGPVMLPSSVKASKDPTLGASLSVELVCGVASY